MKLSDIIEKYIIEEIIKNDIAILKRNELAIMFECVPSQINYVISTRFIPELGFYIESRRGSGGYIKITRSSNKYVYQVLENISHNLSQSVIDVYLNDFIRYNVLDHNTANLIRVAVSDKSLENITTEYRNVVRSDIFKNIIINLI